MPDPLLKETAGIVNNDPGTLRQLKHNLGAELVAAAAAAVADAKYPGIAGVPGFRPRTPSGPDQRYGRAATVAVLSTLADHIEAVIGWQQLHDLADRIERDTTGLPAAGVS